MLECDCHGIVSRERHAPGQHFIKHDCTGVDVAAGRCIVASCLLRRNIVYRTDHIRACKRARGGSCIACNAEIGQLCLPAWGYNHILRLYVPVDDAALMRMGKRIKHLTSIVYRRLWRKRPLFLDDFLQRFSLDIFKHDVAYAVILAYIVGTNDVLM